MNLQTVVCDTLIDKSSFYSYGLSPFAKNVNIYIFSSLLE